jgi:hypothetical protein
VLTLVKTRAEALDRTNDTLRDAADLARRAGRAVQKLRYRDMEYMGTQGLSLAAPSASASARPTPSAKPSGNAKPNASAKPSGSGAPDADDPYQPLVRAYGKLEVEALRYLSAFLELAPLPTRKQTLAEITTLWQESSPPPHTLQQIVRQAALLETDPELKASLTKLDRKTHLVPPAPSAR